MEKIYSVRLNDDDDCVVILDQTLLPTETKYIKLKDKESVWDAIYKLKVRGAPAIGICAAMGVYLSVKNSKATNYEDFYNEFQKNKLYLETSRPTAVNLFWALSRMEECVKSNKEKTNAEIINILKEEALKILEEDIAVCKAIGENGLELLSKGMGLLTHCNAGQLATGKYGTALAPMFLGQERGYDFKVFADETRPLLQGARLTAYELFTSGIDVTLICDNMASIVMQKGLVSAVLVGCDRVAENGDTANKIGTSGVAILAKHYNIPFYVCAPTSTIDLDCKTGKDIEIEERNHDEITKMWFTQSMAPEGVKAFNPAFDVTDASLVTAFITELGIVKAPFDEGFKQLFERKKNGELTNFKEEKNA